MGEGGLGGWRALSEPPTWLFVYPRPPVSSPPKRLGPSGLPLGLPVLRALWVPVPATVTLGPAGSASGLSGYGSGCWSAGRSSQRNNNRRRSWRLGRHFSRDRSSYRRAAGFCGNSRGGRSRLCRRRGWHDLWSSRTVSRRSDSTANSSSYRGLWWGHSIGLSFGGSRLFCRWCMCFRPQSRTTLTAARRARSRGCGGGGRGRETSDHELSRRRSSDVRGRRERRRPRPTKDAASG